MKIDIRTETFHIRSIAPADKDIYMSVRSETSDVSWAYEDIPDFPDFSWQKHLSTEGEINMLVFQQEEQAKEVFVAICNFEDFSGDHVDIGYDVRKEFRGQGIGTKLVPELVSLAHDCFPEKEVLIRIRKDNIASQCSGRARRATLGSDRKGQYGSNKKGHFQSHTCLP